jgi:Uma2 family endonuclease
MVQQTQTPDYTYEEFMKLQGSCQEAGALCRGYELDEGVLVPMAPVDPIQGRIWSQINRHLGNHVANNRLGELFLDSFLDLGRRRWYYPDLAFLSNEDLLRFTGPRLPVPPTLLVEVATDSSTERDTVRKKAVYYEAGVPWYWIVNLVSEQIEEYRHSLESYELVSRVGLHEPFAPALFPGLTIRLEPLIPRTR